MPFNLADRVKETSTTTGTGAIALAGAVSGFRPFATGIAVGDTTYYAIVNTSGASLEFETGIGTLTAATTLARTQILSSSNAGDPVNFSAGTKEVFIDLPAKPARDLVGLPAAVVAMRQDATIMKLRFADLAAGGIKYQDGYADPLIDTSGVDTAQLAGTSYNTTAKRFEPTFSSSGGSDATGNGTPVSSASSQPASNAFDRDLNTVWQSSTAASSHAGAVNLGYDFGAGNALRIARITYRNSTQAATSPSSVKGQYSDNGTSWTDAVTASVSTAASAINTVDIPLAAGPHRYWRLLANANPTNQWRVVEMEMSPYVMHSQTIVSNAFASEIESPSQGRIAVQIDPASVAFSLNTDLVAEISRDNGTTYSSASLSFMETLSDGTALYDGAVSMASQPTGSTIRWRIRTPTAKAIYPNGIILEWRA